MIRVVVAAALLTISACSGSGDDSSDGAADSTGQASASTEPPGSVVDDGDGTDSGGDDSTTTTPPVQATAPLGFEPDVFEIQVPEGGDRVLGAFRDADELIDAGVAAGVWTEIDGLRAVTSVVMGELSPDSIPALDELPRYHYREVIERAVAVIDQSDGGADAAAIADLARLVSFFTAESLTFVETDVPDPQGSESDDTEQDASGDGIAAGITPVGLRSVPSVLRPCYRPQEVVLFGAEASPLGVCFERFENGDDVVIVANHDDAVDISDLVFAVIDQVRPGYQNLAGVELQPVEVLVSLNPSPADSETARGGALAHVASASTNVCRVAIFASDTLTTGTPHLEFTIAHELFHCVQKFWSSARPHAFVEEAGADYFAYEVLGKLCTDPQRALGAELDQATVSGSLLSTTYEGWFFWAFLAEHGHASAQEVASIHEAVYGGAAIDSSVVDALADAPKVLNEFFVRLVGPGLACGFQGERFTSPVAVNQKGPIELSVADIWHGTRYQLNYAAKKLYEQRDDGVGPIGMAEFDKRADAGEWVTTEPEVRTTCTDEKKWMVVVSPIEVDRSAGGPRVLEIDAAKPGGCDPCVLGGWSMDLESFEAYMESLGQGQDIDIAGSYEMNFEPGPPAGGLEYSDQRDIEISFPASGSALAVRLDGAGSGTYSATNGHIQSQGYSDSGTASITGAPVGASSPFANTGDGGAPYTCEDDLLTITVDGNPIYANRLPATPQGPPYFG